MSHSSRKRPVGNLNDLKRYVPRNMR